MACNLVIAPILVVVHIVLVLIPDILISDILIPDISRATNRSYPQQIPLKF